MHFLFWYFICLIGVLFIFIYSFILREGESKRGERENRLDSEVGGILEELGEQSK